MVCSLPVTLQPHGMLASCYTTASWYAHFLLHYSLMVCSLPDITLQPRGMLTSCYTTASWYAHFPSHYILIGCSVPVTPLPQAMLSCILYLLTLQPHGMFMQRLDTVHAADTATLKGTFSFIPVQCTATLAYAHFP